MEISGKTILIISPESWGKNFVSKHHYATYLSKKNKVYFINAVSKWTPKNLIQQTINTKIINENLTTISYSNQLPGLDKFPLPIQSLLFKITARKIQKLINQKNLDIVWNFDPVRFWNFKGWKTKIKIYHPVDEHKDHKLEEIISKHAQFIFSPAQGILDRFKRYNDKCFKIQHGADIESFEKVNPNAKAISLPGKNQIKAGLIGNFHANIDYEIINKCALINPDVDFIFIGPYQSNNLSSIPNLITLKVMELSTLSNVFFIGEVQSSELINYLKCFNINLIMYKERKDNPILNTHKLMGYFYSGNVIISNYIVEYANASRDLIILCQSNEEIPVTIQKVKNNLSIENDDSKKELRTNYAKANSYLCQIEKIGELIYKHPNESKSIN